MNIFSGYLVSFVAGFFDIDYHFIFQQIWHVIFKPCISFTPRKGMPGDIHLPTMFMSRR